MMKQLTKIILSLVLLSSFNTSAIGQDESKLKEIADAIVEEGKALYRLEKTSWLGTDLLMEKHTNKENIGGYLSYADAENTKCIFISRAKKPTVIATVTFDETFDLEKAVLNLDEHSLTAAEESLYTIRTKALNEINSDTLFKTFSNSNLNIIPIIHKGEKKVYILTGPKQNGVMLFGNDYLITFDKKNNITSKKSLHQNLIPIFFSNDKDQQVISSIHSHRPETGDFITPTDICTLMLYAQFSEMEYHYVFSESYVSIWDCKAHTLQIVTKKEFDKTKKIKMPTDE